MSPAAPRGWRRRIADHAAPSAATIVVLTRSGHRAARHRTGVDGVDLVFSPHTGAMIETYERMLRPGGAICAIDEPEGLDLLALKNKSITFHWELMFTRPLYGTDDMVTQHDLLETVAGLVDAGTVRTTLTRELGPLDATTLRQAHELVEAGHMVGKVVLTVDS